MQNNSMKKWDHRGTMPCSVYRIQHHEGGGLEKSLQLALPRERKGSLLENAKSQLPGP